MNKIKSLLESVFLTGCIVVLLSVEALKLLFMVALVTVCIIAGLWLAAVIILALA